MLVAMPNHRQITARRRKAPIRRTLSFIASDGIHDRHFERSFVKKQRVSPSGHKIEMKKKMQRHGFQK